MRLVYHVMSAPAPLGLLFAATSERGLRHLEFMDRRSLKRTIAAHAPANPGVTWEPSVRDLRPLAEALEQYFCGGVREFDFPLDPQGSDYQMKVWRALMDIPYGETRSYGDVAKAIGDPKGARAVGLAVNQNPLPIVVPCHRVIGADGKLVGYSGGLPRKKYLLGLESRFLGVSDAGGDHIIEGLTVKVKRPPAAATARTARSVAKKKRATAPGRPVPGVPAAKAPARRVAAPAAKVTKAPPARTRVMSAAPARKSPR